MQPVRVLRWLALPAILSGLLTPAIADEAKGVWLREEGAARIKIASCGTSLCGTIVWVKNPEGPGHVGQRVFFDMKASGPNTWAGTAFNPEDDRTYSGKLQISGRSMVTTGCALGGLICRSMTWSRVD